MADTPASCSSRRARAAPVRSPGRLPERSFTVTGRPLPSLAAVAIATALSGSSSRDAPAPVLHTLRTGQPMFRSIMSAPASATAAAAMRITSASWPKSWMLTGCSSGWMRRNSRWVRSSPYLRPKLDTISETASPAPYRFACSRTNQFPIPASGASTRRLGSSCPASVHGSLSVGIGARLAPQRGRTPGLVGLKHRMGAKSPTAEQVLARLARRAHGIVTVEEMIRAGLTRREVARRAEKGLLIRQYHGVYRVGHAAPSVDASYMAAVKAAGSEAGLSGRAAAHLLGLLRGPAPAPEVSTAH